MAQDLSAKLMQLEQLERQERLRVNREKSDQKKINDRRCFVVGKIFLETFPEFLKLQPKLDVQDNEREFRVLRDFLSAVAAERNHPCTVNKRTYEPRPNASTARRKTR